MGLSMAAVEPGSKESLENSLHVEQGGNKEHFSFKESHKSNICSIRSRDAWKHEFPGLWTGNDILF